MEQTKAISEDDVLIDDEFDEEDGSLEELESPEVKLQAARQTWRDIEIQRELRMLERQLGEKLDKEIFN